MESKIKLLSSETINKIAAGEVIESPASVVKELVENALDAKACKITIEILAGGLKLIRVSDNGCGMSREDALFSIIRHATSKIVKVEDLLHLSTKGFRGEALASMAAISKMTITTATEKEMGLQLEIEEGAVCKEKICAKEPGTTIEVRSLFYNVPVRKKFQKSPAAIAAEVFRMVTWMGLSHPEVQFELLSNGRQTVKTKGSAFLKDRVEELLGADFALKSTLLEFEKEPYSFSGVLANPMDSRPNKMGQYVFLNQRAVICPSIAEAIRLGYGTRLSTKRYPAFVLQVKVPAPLVDVNVHPQKLYVRLLEEELLCEHLKNAVEMALVEKKVYSPPPFSERLYSPFKEGSIETEISLSFQEEAPKELVMDLEFAEAEFLGQQKDLLLFKEESFDGIVMVDAKAATFRLFFEEMLLAKEGFDKQLLLFPLEIELQAIEAAMLLTHLDAMEEGGFSLTPKNKTTFLLHAIPSFLDLEEAKTAVLEMANALQEFIGQVDYKIKRQKRLLQISARFAKSKLSYSKEEAHKLWHRLKQCKDPFFCPKGNKTMGYIQYETCKNLLREDQKAYALLTT